MNSKINSLSVCLLLIVQTCSLSLRNKVKSLDLTPQQKVVAKFIKSLVKDNVEFHKRETDEAYIYEIWVYHNKKDEIPEEAHEKLDDIVEELTENLVEELQNPETFEPISENIPEPEKGIQEDEVTPVQEDIEEIAEELTPKQEERVEQLLNEEELSSKQEEELKEILEEELPRITTKTS